MKLVEFCFSNNAKLIEKVKDLPTVIKYTTPDQWDLLQADILKELSELHSAMSSMDSSRLDENTQFGFTSSLKHIGEHVEFFKLPINNTHDVVAKKLKLLLIDLEINVPEFQHQLLSDNEFNSAEIESLVSFVHDEFQEKYSKDWDKAYRNKADTEKVKKVCNALVGALNSKLDKGQELKFTELMKENSAIRTHIGLSNLITLLEAKTQVVGLSETYSFTDMMDQKVLLKRSIHDLGRFLNDDASSLPGSQLELSDLTITIDEMKDHEYDGVALETYIGQITSLESSLSQYFINDHTRDDFKIVGGNISSIKDACENASHSAASLSNAKSEIMDIARATNTHVNSEQKVFDPCSTDWYIVEFSDQGDPSDQEMVSEIVKSYEDVQIEFERSIGDIKYHSTQLINSLTLIKENMEFIQSGIQTSEIEMTKKSPKARPSELAM